MDWILDSPPVVDEDQKKSPLQSLKAYILVAVAGVAFLVILCIIMMYNPCRQKMIKKLKDTKRKFMWNGFLRSFYISLMTLWLSVAQQLIKLRTDSLFLKPTDLYSAYGIAVFCLFVPTVSWIFLQKNRRYLGTLQYKEKYDNLYADISLRRDDGKYSLMYYPIFMYRRCIFMMWPVVFVHE